MKEGIEQAGLASVRPDSSNGRSGAERLPFSLARTGGLAIKTLSYAGMLFTGSHFCDAVCMDVIDFAQNIAGDDDLPSPMDSA